MTTPHVSPLPAAVPAPALQQQNQGKTENDQQQEPQKSGRFGRGWNHRVVRRVWPNGEIGFAIHEAYYTDDAVDSITTDSIAPYGESHAELRAELLMMLRACQNPAIEYDGYAEIPSVVSDASPWLHDERVVEYRRRLRARIETTVRDAFGASVAFTAWDEFLVALCDAVATAALAHSSVPTSVVLAVDPSRSTPAAAPAGVGGQPSEGAP